MKNTLALMLALLSVTIPSHLYTQPTSTQEEITQSDIEDFLNSEEVEEQIKEFFNDFPLKDKETLTQEPAGFRIMFIEYVAPLIERYPFLLDWYIEWLNFWESFPFSGSDTPEEQEKIELNNKEKKAFLDEL